MRIAKWLSGRQRYVSSPGVEDRFLAMDTVSTRRFKAAAEKMQSAGFADAEQKQTPVDMALESWTRLRNSVQKMSGIFTPARTKK